MIKKSSLILFIFLLSNLTYCQVFVQTQNEATVGLDRKNWNMGSVVFHSQGSSDTSGERAIVDLISGLGD